MDNQAYRFKVNVITIVSAGAFAGGNLFIGLSMGSYWLSIDPSVFYQEFWSQFLRFLFTIMPLFLLLPIGLILSARLDWQDLRLRRLWITTFILYGAITLITSIIHLPLNLQMGAATYSPAAASAEVWYGLISLFGQASPENTAGNRSYWLLWHIPRILISLAICFVSLQAVLRR